MLLEPSTTVPVDGDQFAGTDDDDVAQGEAFDGDQLRAAVAFAQGLLGPQREQGLDGALGTFDGVALQHVGEAEKEKQQGALKRGADRRRAQSGEHHEHIDIERPLAQRGDGGTHAVLPAEEVGAAVEPVRHAPFAQQMIRDERRDEEKQADCAGGFLVEVAQAEALPERGPDGWGAPLKGLDFRPGGPHAFEDGGFFGHTGIEGEAEHAPDVGGGGAAHAGHLFDAALEFGCCCFAGLSVQPQSAPLQSPALGQDVLQRDVADVLLGKPGGIECDLDALSVGLGLDRDNALVVRDGVGLAELWCLLAHGLG